MTQGAQEHTRPNALIQQIRGLFPRKTAGGRELAIRVPLESSTSECYLRRKQRGFPTATSQGSKQSTEAGGLRASPRSNLLENSIRLRSHLRPAGHRLRFRRSVEPRRSSRER